MPDLASLLTALARFWRWAPVALFAAAVLCVTTGIVLAGLHVRYAEAAQIASVIAAAVLIAAGLVIACRTGGKP